jgi:hypothetical protein
MPGRCVQVRGILRVGTKQLYVRPRPDQQYECVSPLCVLDFYVHEATLATPRTPRHRALAPTAQCRCR